MDLPAGYRARRTRRIWEGEIVPSFTEDYTFYVVGSGTATLHDQRHRGRIPTPPAVERAAAAAPTISASSATSWTRAATAACQNICDKDPYCCNGGYLSYYSFEPEWDARCIAEVATYCAPASSARRRSAPPGSPQKKPAADAAAGGRALRDPGSTYSNPSTDKTIRLLWASARQAKQAVPQFALLPGGRRRGRDAGSGLNVTYFGDQVENGSVKPDLDRSRRVAGSVSDFSLTPTIGQLGMPLVDVLAAPVDAASGQPSPPSVVRPRYGEEVFVDGGGTCTSPASAASAGGCVRIIGGRRRRRGRRRSDPNGDFAADVPLAPVGTHTLKLVQQTYAVEPVRRARAVRGQLRRSRLADHGHARDRLAEGADDPVADRSDPQRGRGATVFNVVGQGTAGAVHIVDQGIGAANAFTDILARREREVLGADHARPGNAGRSAQGLAQAGVRSGRRRPATPVFVERRHRSADGGVPAQRRRAIDCDARTTVPPQSRSGRSPYPAGHVRAAARDGGDRARGARRSSARRSDRASPAAGRSDPRS